ncbi:hypothetical protein C8J57DRAFT_1130730 [Mycena rebaudengoi]|nr:hypothetical protein C8J57DRAFT_1130730 [Mycena rebaudengoi]
MATKFLHRELKALPRYIRRNGPLRAPEKPTAVVLPNPFLPWRNPKTGRWAPPKYSLRQQADLIKKAKSTNTAHLLPPSIKLLNPELLAPPPPPRTAPPLARKTASLSRTRTPVAAAAPRRIKAKPQKDIRVTVEWDRKPVQPATKGAELGTRLYSGRKRMFKGSKLERVRSHRDYRTRVLLHDMRKRIRRYKTMYVHKKKNPLKPSKGTQKKLPF